MSIARGSSSSISMLLPARKAILETVSRGHSRARARHFRALPGIIRGRSPREIKSAVDRTRVDPEREISFIYRTDVRYSYIHSPITRNGDSRNESSHLLTFLCLGVGKQFSARRSTRDSRKTNTENFAARIAAVDIGRKCIRLS